MKTKNVYIYICRFQGQPISCSSLTLAHARTRRQGDIRNGWPVSTIVKVAVPLPEAPR